MRRIKEKSLTCGVPQTREQVVWAIAEIGRRERERSRLEAEMNDELSAIKERYEEAARPHAEAIKALTLGVQVWCEANRDALTQGGRVKTCAFESGEVKWRTTPPRVVVRGMDEVLDQLKRLGLERLIRVKEEVNKEAVLSEPDAVVAVRGITITRGEIFEVVPFEMELTS